MPYFPDYIFFLLAHSKKYWQARELKTATLKSRWYSLFSAVAGFQSIYLKKEKWRALATGRFGLKTESREQRHHGLLGRLFCTRFKQVHNGMVSKLRNPRCVFPTPLPPTPTPPHYPSHPTCNYVAQATSVGSHGQECSVPESSAILTML